MTTSASRFTLHTKRTTHRYSRNEAKHVLRTRFLARGVWARVGTWVASIHVHGTTTHNIHHTLYTINTSYTDNISNTLTAPEPPGEPGNTRRYNESHSCRSSSAQFGIHDNFTCFLAIPCARQRGHSDHRMTRRRRKSR